ncbi:MAG: hypothetical protein KDK64_00865 [Chlamydiia bacterium]|nr:hypothetical protein [Chlamydiia bacterium]
MRKALLAMGMGMAVLLTGCASYQANSLSALDPQCVREYPEIEGMQIGCKAFNEEDCYTFLDRNVIAKGYQPIQLTFQNNTNKRYVFTTQNVSLPCVSPETVANTVHTSTVGRVAGYSVGGLFLWPLFIPAVVDGIKSSNANKALDMDFNDKMKQQFVIAPRGYAKTLIFVPKSQMSPIFDVSLLEEDTGKYKTVGLTVVQ